MQDWNTQKLGTILYLSFPKDEACLTEGVGAEPEPEVSTDPGL